MITNESNLKDQDWERLLEAIETGRCTPILGPGVSFGHVPSAGEIAKQWSMKYAYPLDDSYNLSRVAQFVAVEDGVMPPRDLLSRQLKMESRVDVDNPNEPYRILADLPLSLYVTTTFDELMLRALEQRRRSPHRELCLWNRKLHHQESSSPLNFQPSPANPMVFHLQGSVEVPESLVLTEDDYVDFLLNVAGDDSLLPRIVQRAFESNLLLFLGLRLDDWNFRIVYKALSDLIERNPRKAHFAVMALPLNPKSDEGIRGDDYLVRYFEKLNFRMYWGTVAEFTSELKSRREAKNGSFM